MSKTEDLTGNDLETLRRSAKAALLRNITKQAPITNTAAGVHLLAEAYAWVVSPEQSHGAKVKVDN
ncbi:hypothetical protein [Saccharothrix violaceirubra]|uniref:Uncharacterized protein n=1 Tax=Saccharothrix violaceirubra TaxID=413306 RepID=A0A7W7T322_9PSEU|nr:hypothetical protein [Saccharothrix violaceirubra]MBB4965680.1 hypothetical protein [Saccharothrix violaceirubra]